MQDITLQQIEIFLAVAEQLSLSGAARDLFINQSAVSRWIQRLEKSLNTQLFIRSNKGVELTADGEFLYSEFRPLFDKLGNTLQNIHAMYNTPENVLRVGCYHSDELVTELRSQIKPFEESHPDVLIKLDLFEYKELKEALLCGSVDCAVSYDIGFSFPKSTESKPFRALFPKLAISKSHPLMKGGKLDLSGLNGETMLLVMTPESSYSEEWKLNICRKNGFVPQNIEYLPSPFAREIAIKNGRGFSIGGSDQNCHFPSEIKLFPIEPADGAQQKMLIHWRKNGLSTVTKELIESIKGV
ncbi:MAG: LysR family transcriptional regulator [Oscillospiraceae bacterium]|nr:LysR family transcriptional regulator [Oscillospiraceae bacterium]